MTQIKAPLISLNAALAVVLSIALNASVWAHGPAKSQHGGIVKTANDLSFELVSSSKGVTIYVVDHGKPKLTQGATGQVTVLQGKNKRQVSLTPVGDSALQAEGVALNAGVTLVASVTFADKSSATVRFKGN